MTRIIALLVTLIFSLPVNAGKITIEKSDSLIRNELFDAKRERAEEYKRLQEQRRINNRYWSDYLSPQCFLLKKLLPYLPMSRWFIL